jgi:hypothetical protein
MQEVNVNFTYDGADYNVSFTPRESYYIHPLKIGDKEFSIRVSFTNNYISVYKTNDDPFAVDEKIYFEKLRINKIRASKFLEWYISQDNNREYISDRSIDMMFGGGKSCLNVVDLFNECKKIPKDICDSIDQVFTHYMPSELIFEDDLTKAEMSDRQKMYYY